jgi:hypothetical protein
MIYYLRTENYLPIALKASAWILHMQILTILQGPKLKVPSQIEPFEAFEKFGIGERSI